MPAGGPSAARDPAGATTEHRIISGEDEHIGAELGPDRAQQSLQQPRAARTRHSTR